MSVYQTTSLRIKLRIFVCLDAKTELDLRTDVDSSVTGGRRSQRSHVDGNKSSGPDTRSSQQTDEDDDDYEEDSDDEDGIWSFYALSLHDQKAYC